MVQLVCHFWNNVGSPKVADPPWSFNASAWQILAQRRSGDENGKRFCCCQLVPAGDAVVELPVVAKAGVALGSAAAGWGAPMGQLCGGEVAAALPAELCCGSLGTGRGWQGRAPSQGQPSLGLCPAQGPVMASAGQGLGAGAPWVCWQRAGSVWARAEGEGAAWNNEMRFVLL